MNVKELKEIIDNLPDDMEVILQRDAEGNGYEGLRCVDPDCLMREFGYECEVYSTEWSADDAGFEEDEWEEFKKQPRVLVLSP